MSDPTETRFHKEDGCDSCHFDAELVTWPNDARGKVPHAPPFFDLCDLCANTLTANALMWPEQYRGQTAILRTICYVGNAILAALKEAP